MKIKIGTIDTGGISPSPFTIMTFSKKLRNDMTKESLGVESFFLS